MLGEPRPGRKLVLTGDTAPSPLVVQAAHGADLLVHEASFLSAEAERARETMHSTAAEAAEVARLAQVRLLALTHVSPRYFGPELAEEARAVFPETVVPRDFDLIEVPFPERGAPRLVKGGGAATACGAGGSPYDRAVMSGMVQLATAGDVAEAEEMQEILRNAGHRVVDRAGAGGRRGERARPRGRARDGAGRDRGAHGARRPHLRAVDSVPMTTMAFLRGRARLIAGAATRSPRSS